MNYDIEEEKQKIVTELRSRGYANKSINYAEFLGLYEPYKQEMKETDFALILGINYSNYKRMKNAGTRAKILKTGDITAERKEEIQAELRGKGYANKSISYAEFLELYEPYKQEMKETDFALILGISYNVYYNIKNKKKKAKMLKTGEITIERKEEIQTEIRSKGYSNKPISYAEFLELYEPYKQEMKETDFALILGINYSNYKSMKNIGTRTQILKTEEITAEQKREIQAELTSKGYANTFISYAEFLELYEPYKNGMKETDFALILGINYDNYMSMKNAGTRTEIEFNYDIKQRVKHIFSEAKNYSLNYIQQVSAKYGITIEDIARYLFNRNKYFCDMMTEALYSRGQLFIGKKRLGQDFADKYIEKISNYAHDYSKKIGRILHTAGYSEDIAQEVLISAIKTQGDLTENFNDEDAISVLNRWLSATIKAKHLSQLKIKRDISLDESVVEDGKRTRYSIIPTGENIQKKVENKLSQEEQVTQDTTPVELMRQCLESGMNSTSAINYCMQQFHLTQAELLQTMTDYLSSKSEIKTDSRGNVYLRKRQEDR